jgi:hypothetical protein
MSPIWIATTAFAVIMAGALLGAFLGAALPGKHLTDETKEVIRLGTGLVGTIAALVLGLLIASAKTSYDAQSGQLRQIAADIVLLDKLLEQYGPEARPARAQLRLAIGPMVDRIWRESIPASRRPASFAANAASEKALADILGLAPQTDVQTLLKSRAIQLGMDLSQSRVLLFEEAETPIPIPFLTVLVFWLTIIFASFSLFTRLNATLIALLVVFDLSAAGAIFLVLEMSQPFTGIMQISSAPLRNALAALGP